MALWRWWESRREVERRLGSRAQLDALARIECRCAVEEIRDRRAEGPKACATEPTP